ncbi:unnamed protein product [Rhizopus microsporus]|uniref:Uncharacterized protein n=1 Tax=Rhizopus microsporus TaxID=58291 RepID=A0A1X0RXK9_RHIZD|nr:hypothetical protein BCV71DRAFT_12041 [Rhizopus microsporus]
MNRSTEMMNQIASVKLVLLGDSAVGKSSIITKYATDTFVEGREATIGAAFLAKICVTEDRTVKFDIWDTAGQERFRSLAPMYYRNAAAALVVFDVTNYNSFIGAKRWIDELPSDVMVALVGNKIDLETQRQVSTEEVQEYIKENSLLYIETSACLGTNVDHVFKEIARNVSLRKPSRARQIELDKQAQHSSCAC